ncbi:DUF3545 family protein [Motilimonas cestriensis]|uniref:DUF3545 family protein n=1 Tax=Motilimonas cestriensis TaxID=2742685 RepID=A0ABS8WC96_9GAMM|nr:DUF3545 family protein [Motilimonas cestriensis]MCE2595883.1 DUF3545 family protein [Motilimonas cestriensis]
MDELDFNIAPNSDAPQRGKTKEKRRWREIEAIKEEQRLRKELMDINPILDELVEYNY